MATNKWLTSLNKNLEIEVKFVSHDVMSAKDFDDYAVKTTLNAGNRCFATKTKALEWVGLMNKEYGDNTASFVGKFNNQQRRFSYGKTNLSLRNRPIQKRQSQS